MTIEHLGATRITGPEACAKILLVGEVNPYGGDPRYALYHEPKQAAGARLQAKIFGVRAREHYLSMWRANLCTGGWDVDEATMRAIDLSVSAETPWSVVVLLGKKVVAAFRRMDWLTGFNPEAFSIHAATRPAGAPMTFVYLPHPSGRNTLWNVTANVTRAREVMARVAQDVPWGEI